MNKYNNRGPRLQVSMVLYLILMFGIGMSVQGYAQFDNTQIPVDLTELSLEDLANLPVTSVSKKSEKLHETAAAIAVITSKDIRRYGRQIL